MLGSDFLDFVAGVIRGPVEQKHARYSGNLSYCKPQGMFTPPSKYMHIHLHACGVNPCV